MRRTKCERERRARVDVLISKPAADTKRTVHGGKSGCKAARAVLKARALTLAGSGVPV